MTSTDTTRDPTDWCQADDRICVLPTDDGVVIYDAERPSRWVASDHTTDLADRR